MNWYKKASATVWLANRISRRGGFVKMPAVYIRAGDPPPNQEVSFNYFEGVPEKGVSVYKAWFDPRTSKYVLQSGGESMMSGQNDTTDRPLYLVEGVDTGQSGGDAEDLLDPKTIKIIRQLNPDEIVFEQDPWLTLTGKELTDEETPNWDGLQ